MSWGGTPPLKRVVIVYKTHFDIGYTDLAKNVVNLYRTAMIERTLQVIDANRELPKQRQFVWTIPGWPMEQMLWKGQNPQRKAKIEQAIRNGNLVVHALPFNTHTETMEIEDVVRGLYHSSDVARRYGLPLPRREDDGRAGATWLMPTVCRHAGIDFFHIGVNDATSAPKTPLLFWWEGPDGSRLLTMLTNTYGTWRDPPKDWPCATWLAILLTYDNCGPPGPETVKSDLDFYAKNYPGVEVHVGQLSDFYDALTREELSRVPVMRPTSRTAGSTVRPVRRAVAARLPWPPTAIGDRIPGDAQCGLGCEDSDPRQAVAAAYEQSLLWSEHTWGLANINFTYRKEGSITKAIPGPEKDIQRMLASWQEHSDYARNIRNTLEKPCGEQMRALAGHVRGAGRRVVVFNSLPGATTSSASKASGIPLPSCRRTTDGPWPPK